jgi:hypothetical protein
MKARSLSDLGALKKMLQQQAEDAKNAPGANASCLPPRWGASRH